MLDLSTLLAFSGAVLLLMMSPGPNMAFVLSHGVAYGPKGGVAAAMGIAAADVVLTAAVATGIGAAVANWPWSLDLVRYGGAAYLLWLAFNALRVRTTVIHESVLIPAGLKVFYRSALNSLLNPKALLFFLTFLPAFVDTARGQVAMQLVSLGLLLTLISTVFHSALGIAGARLRHLAPPGSTRKGALHMVHALVLAGLAIWVILG